MAFVLILRAIGCLLGIAGIIWFCIPATMHAFSLGSIFGIGYCLSTIALILFATKLIQKGGWRRVAAYIWLGASLLSFVWFGYLTVLMNSAQNKKPPADVNVIVLGAQVHMDGRLSLSLLHRVDVAYQYLLENPRANCIVTGGQGPNEPYPEALAEARELEGRGIATDRIFLEDKSSNTRQNMENAYLIAKNQDLSTTVAVATQDFHMYRALSLAEAVGFTAYSLPAKTEWRLFPGYYGRELLSLTKWHIERLFE